MLSRVSVGAGALSVLACVAGASAQPTINLFGQRYSVQRFNYSEQVKLPSPVFPGEQIDFIESEGIVFQPNGTVLMSVDDIADIAFGNPDNWVAEISVQVTGPTPGLAFSRAVVRSNPAQLPPAPASPIIPAAGFDLNPSGITINAGSSGFGAGGNLVVLNGDGILYAFSLDPATLGQPLGSFDVSAFNVNAEDVAFVPPIGSEPARFLLINQDSGRVERYAVTAPAAPASSFAVGGLADPGLTGAVEKGLAYSPASSKLPLALQNPAGVLFVAFDDNFPALQAFLPDGTLLETEKLTTDGTPFGPSRLDLTGCPLTALQLESLTIDPATGRLFLSNQGSFTDCNYLYVLTPVCPADFNGDGAIGSADLTQYLNAWFSDLANGTRDARFGSPRNAPTGSSDLTAFISFWFSALAGGC